MELSGTCKACTKWPNMKKFPCLYLVFSCGLAEEQQLVHESYIFQFFVNEI